MILLRYGINKITKRHMLSLSVRWIALRRGEARRASIEEANHVHSLSPTRVHCRTHALTQFNPTVASAMRPERTAEIIAAQLHRRGVVCTAPRSPVRDAAASVAHESVWALVCDEASYLVRLVPAGRRVEITPLSIGTVVESHPRRSSPC